MPIKNQWKETYLHVSSIWDDEGPLGLPPEGEETP